MAADVAAGNTSDEDSQKRIQACMAMDMKYQAISQALLAQSILFREIAEGSKDIKDFGFPEFSDG